MKTELIDLGQKQARIIRKGKSEHGHASVKSIKLSVPITANGYYLSGISLFLSFGFLNFIENVAF